MYSAWSALPHVAGGTTAWRKSPTDLFATEVSDGREGNLPPAFPLFARMAIRRKAHLGDRSRRAR